jgi:hypothetical protein
MNTNQVLATLSPVTVGIYDLEGELTASTMTLPTGAVVQVDCFDCADPSVGIFEPVIVLEVGVMVSDMIGAHFKGAGIFVEVLDTDEDVWRFTFAPV